MSAAYAVDDARMSWGRVVRARHHIARPRFEDELAAVLARATADGRSALPVGLGRSYGDSNLNPDGALIDLCGLDRILAFDPDTGVLRVEAGASLSDILRFSVPRGWFLPTTPGTRFVTIAGAVANDVHGKNHQHAGSMGCWVRGVGLVRSDRGALDASMDRDGALFAATIGGLGLTGVIAWVELQLVPIPSACIDQEIIPFETLADFFDISEHSRDRFEFTVSWIDCTSSGQHLGKGVFTRGNWAPEGGYRVHSDKLKLTLPVDGSSLAFNPIALRMMNAGYRGLQMMQAGQSRTHYVPHLYPLDAIGAWNRAYGARGFYQYQCVTPHETSRDAVAEMLRAIAKDGSGSVLVVLKTLGDTRSPGMLSFPMPGVTLAMDFCNLGDRTQRLFARLDAIVREAKGRLYPAKDGRIPADMFQAGYQGWREFAAHVDPALSSSFWRRVSQ